MKIDPSLYLLSTLIVPPINSTNLLVMASPKPVPSAVVFLSTSSRSNFVNNLLISSALIPRPLSLTLMISKQVSCLLMHFTFNSTKPFSVYLMAFDNKLFTTCLT